MSDAFKLFNAFKSGIFTLSEFILNDTIKYPFVYSSVLEIFGSFPLFITINDDGSVSYTIKTDPLTIGKSGDISSLLDSVNMLDCQRLYNISCSSFTNISNDMDNSFNNFKNDYKELIYDLRRLAKYTGDVYVREPSGIGYWATLTVSFNLKHMAVTVPVTFNITRVEGGI